MTDHFSVLGLPRALDLDPDSLESAWRALTLEESTEPSSSESLEAIHEARSVLGDPARRLAHWLELSGTTPDRSGTMAGDLVDLFGTISATLQRTDDVLARHRGADSALARALLTKEVIAVQQEIQETLQHLRKQADAVVARFPDWQQGEGEDTTEEALEGLRRLQFLRKWESECHNRLLALIEC